MYAHGDVYFVFLLLFFFCNLISPFFSFFLSLPSLFFCLFLRIPYAGSFGPRLICVDGDALRRYNSNPNIVGLKI